MGNILVSIYNVPLIRLFLYYECHAIHELYCSQIDNNTLFICECYVLYVHVFLLQTNNKCMYLGCCCYRYMKYMADLVGNKPFKPHSRSLYILMLRLSSVPLYNESK